MNLMRDMGSSLDTTNTGPVKFLRLMLFQGAQLLLVVNRERAQEKKPSDDRLLERETDGEKHERNDLKSDNPYVIPTICEGLMNMATESPHEFISLFHSTVRS
mmetsp:Transcript_44601/g.60962  ORF Transcript_44601/g.60962 Transcript_44601/m.60962 type:complete len:103 (-) Transcript_44601:717-1025(-)